MPNELTTDTIKMLTRADVTDEKDLNALRDVLWNMYQEHCTHGRHHESQRSTVTNLILAVTAGIIAIVGFDKEITFQDLPAALFLIGLGAFGAGFSTKHYERFHLHMERARNYRNALDELLPQLNSSNQSKRPYIKALKKDADERHEKEFLKLQKWKLHTWSLHRWWLTLYVLIIVLGVILALVAVNNFVCSHHYIRCIVV